MTVQSPNSRVRSRLTAVNTTMDHQANLNADTLQHELWKALRATGYFMNRQNEITFEISSDGHVLLRGSVPSYYHKQRAQIAVMSVAGVRSLHNDLLVKSTDKPSHLEDTDHDHVV